MMCSGVYLSYILCRGKLRLVIYRCLHQATYVLGAPTGLIGRLVPVVVDTLVGALCYCSSFINNKLLKTDIYWVLYLVYWGCSLHHAIFTTAFGKDLRE